MIKAWNLAGKVSTNLLGDNQMAFILNEEKDTEKFQNLSWNFRDHQVVVVEWPPKKSLDEINLDHTNF